MKFRYIKKHTIWAQASTNRITAYQKSIRRNSFYINICPSYIYISFFIQNSIPTRKNRESGGGVYSAAALSGVKRSINSKWPSCGTCWNVLRRRTKYTPAVSNNAVDKAPNT